MECGANTFFISNDCPLLTLTYLISMSNVRPDAFKRGIFQSRWLFWKLVEARVITITRYVKPNETLAINKFQRSELTFYL